MKLTDIHGKPIVNRRRAAQEALRQFKEDLERDYEDDLEDSDYGDWDDYDDDDYDDDWGDEWIDDVSTPLKEADEETKDNPRL